MHLFITGATGYIGSVIVEKAIQEGHTVHGLSRSPSGDAKLLAQGAIPVRGDLTTLTTLTQESAKADAVIHCAFNHDFLGKGMSLEDVLHGDEVAIDAMAQGVKGTDKPLIVSSGSGGREQDPNGGEVDETTPISEAFPIKARNFAEERIISEKSRDGIRIIAIRVAPFTYGRGGSHFLPFLIAKARATGEALYVGDGCQRVTDLHVDDAATLYLAAAKHGKTGVYNATGSTTVTAKEMAEAVGTLLNVPVRSISTEEAVKEESFGPVLATFFGLECRSSNRKAREELGWTPTGVGLLSDIAKGSYKQLEASLTKKA